MAKRPLRQGPFSLRVAARFHLIACGLHQAVPTFTPLTRVIGLVEFGLSSAAVNRVRGIDQATSHQP
jgi:hypothetical protein